MTETTQTTSLCHRCKYGAKPGYMRECKYPYLKIGKTIPRTLKNTLIVSNAEAVAKAKGIEGFNPLASIAPAVAATSGKCHHFKPTI